MIASNVDGDCECSEASVNYSTLVDYFAYLIINSEDGELSKNDDGTYTYRGVCKDEICGESRETTFLLSFDSIGTVTSADISLRYPESGESEKVLKLVADNVVYDTDIE